MTDLHLTGDVDGDMFRKLCQALDSVEREKRRDVFNVVLMSDGGDAAAALGMYDRIRLSRLTVVVTAYGLVASAAVIILIGADRRRMAKNAMLMVHEDVHAGLGELTTSELEAYASHARRSERVWNNIMVQHSKLRDKPWEAMNRKETYLDSEESLRYGLVDEVL